MKRLVDIGDISEVAREAAEGRSFPVRPLYGIGYVPAADLPDVGAMSAADATPALSALGYVALGATLGAGALWLWMHSRRTEGEGDGSF